MSALEQLVLDGLALNDGAILDMESLSIPPPPKKPDWVSGADSDGALLGRSPTYENRVIEARIRVVQQTTADAARAHIGTVIDKLQECERNALGLPVVWTPADATTPPITFRCLLGELPDLPVDWEGGWLVRAPSFTIRLTCLPFGEGAQVGYVNWASNPSFEVDTAGWSTTLFSLNSGATLTRQTTFADQGTASGRIVTTAASAAQGAALPCTALGTFRKGQSYAARVRIRGTAGGEALQVLLGATATDVVTVAHTAQTSFQTVTVGWVPTADRAGSTHGLAVRTTNAEIVTVYIDSIVIVEGTVADLPAYFDGATGAGYAWFGTAYASPSAGPYAASTSAPLVTVDVADIPGDVDALGELLVVDGASQARRFVAWGMEQRWNPTISPPSHTVDSTAMVTNGYLGTTVTLTGAYSSATNNAISATLRSVNQAICGLGTLTHTGDYRPHLRCYSTSATIALRLAYRVGDGPWHNLPWRTLPATGFCNIDMGLVEIPSAVIGAQQWTGRIEAYSTSAAGGETLYVDVLWLMPAERYGKARAPYVYGAPVLNAYDEYGAMTGGAVLHGRAAISGGTWATSGATTDYTAVTGSVVVDLTRSTISQGTPRSAILGATAFTNSEASTRFYWSSIGSVQSGAYARWVDANNYLVCYVGPYTGSTQLFTIQIFVAGVSQATNGQAQYVQLSPQTWYQVRVIVYSTGFAVGTLMTLDGGTIAQCTAQSAVLATGGALDDGKPGIHDQNSGADPVTRYYRVFYHATPAPEPLVINSGRLVSFRDDDTLRQDSTGATVGPPPEPTGARFLLPPEGGEQRKARFAVLARRNDIQTMADDGVTSNATMDSTAIAVIARPRYLAIPR